MRYTTEGSIVVEKGNFLVGSPLLLVKNGQFQSAKAAAEKSPVVLDASDRSNTVVLPVPVAHSPVIKVAINKDVDAAALESIAGFNKKGYTASLMGAKGVRIWGLLDETENNKLIRYSHSFLISIADLQSIIQVNSLAHWCWERREIFLETCGI